jgi:Integrase core domain/GAG-pre-integrase domain
VIFQDQESGKKIGEGFFKNGLYYLKEPINKCHVSLSLINHDKLLHCRFGHPSDQVLNKLFFYNLDSSNCDVCKLAKQTRLPFSLSTSISEAKFELVHSDVWGPAPVDSYNHFKYFVTFIDDFSRTTWVYLLKGKNEVFSCFKDFLNFVGNQYSAKIKVFRSDNGTEYVNKKIFELLKSKGILYQTTCINTPEQNGVSERKIVIF